MRRGERGVTLIEIAVILAIVGIMALVMAPAIGEWVDNFRIRQSARDISSTLQEAKMKTISTRTQHTVNFYEANNTYQLLPGGSVTQVSRGVNIVSGSTASVTFSPDGTSSNGTITLDNEEGKTYNIEINSVGRISMQEE
jgi:general secretion pathway protein H